jgi:hypothetical protein
MNDPVDPASLPASSSDSRETKATATRDLSSSSDCSEPKRMFSVLAAFAAHNNSITIGDRRERLVISAG